MEPANRISLLVPLLVPVVLGLVIVLALATAAGAQASCDTSSLLTVPYHKVSRVVGSVPSLRQGDQFGRSIAFAGDVDGDGVGDLVVGAHGDDGLGEEGANRGAVHVLFLDADARVRATFRIGDGAGGFPAGVLEDGDGFGRALAAADLDGDGRAEILVGANGDDDAGPEAGAVYVLFLNGPGFPVSPRVRAFHKISPRTAPGLREIDWGDHFGRALAPVRGLWGGGSARVDLAVGAPSRQGPPSRGGGQMTGAIYLLDMNADGSVAGVVRQIGSGFGGFPDVLRAGDWFGFSLANMGDVDGNGVEDLAVGVPQAATGGDTGTAWLLRLTPWGDVRVADNLTGRGFPRRRLDVQDLFGFSVANLGDLDGDRFPELAVGALYDDSSDRNGGAFYVLYLGTGGSAGGAARAKGVARITENEGGLRPVGRGSLIRPQDGFGSALALTVDPRGAKLPFGGACRLVVGSRFDDDGAMNAGAVYMLDLGSWRMGFNELHNGSGRNLDRLRPAASPVVGCSWSLTLDPAPTRFAILRVCAGGRAPSPAFLPGAGGEVLCSTPCLGRPTAAGPVFATFRGQNHTVPIPPDPSLVGLTLCTQAFAVGDLRTVATNAIDVTLGTVAAF